MHLVIRIKKKALYFLYCTFAFKIFSAFKHLNFNALPMACSLFGAASSCVPTVASPRPAHVTCGV